MGHCPVFPQVNPLPYPYEEAASLHAQRHRLGSERRADVGRHVVIAFVVVLVAGAIALAIQRA